MAVIGNPGAVPQALSQRKLIRFGALREAWKLYTEQIGVWLLAAFVIFGIALFLQAAFSIVTGAFGPTKHTIDGTVPAAGSPAAMVLTSVFHIVEWIVVFVLIGGMFRMATTQLRGEEITLGHLFEAVDVLPSLLGAAVLVGLAVGAGTLCFVLPGLFIAALLMFVLPLIVDKHLNVGEAMRRSWNALKGDWFMAMLFFVVVGLIGASGALLFGIGVILTAPFAVLAVSVLYRDFFAYEPRPIGIRRLM